MDDSAVLMVRVPREAASLGVIRAVVGSAAAGADLTYSQVDDLRIAVGEAAAALVAASGGGETLVVSIDPTPRNVQVRLVVDPPLDPSVAFPAGSLAALIVNGLADEFLSGEDDRGSWVQITKRGDL